MLWIQKVEPFVGLSQLTSTLSQFIPPLLWISRELFTSEPRTESSTRSRHHAGESDQLSDCRFRRDCLCRLNGWKGLCSPATRRSGTAGKSPLDLCLGGSRR